MTIPNPEYNPAWEAIHDYHHEHRSRLEKEKRTIRRDITLGMSSEEYKRLNSEWKAHHQTCEHCFDTLQHKTVQDYCKWRTDGWEFEHPVFQEHDIPLPNPENFETLEQARQALLKINNIIGKYETLEQYGAKAGRPDGLDIFEKCADNRLHTIWKHYMLQDFKGDPLPDLITLVTVDDRHTDKHVCFFADDHRDRTFVPTYLKHMAASFIAEDSNMRYIDYALRKNKEKKRIFKWQQKLCGTKQLTDYHFYIHSMPNLLHGEALYAFRMEHNWRANYIPERAHPTQAIMRRRYKTVPQALIDGVKEHIGFNDICLERC